jgi:hypothetical protein
MQTEERTDRHDETNDQLFETFTNAPKNASSVRTNGLFYEENWTHGGIQTRFLT